MTGLPRVVTFDVNGTLSDLAPLADRLAEVGARPELLPVWFAGVLRDGLGLTAAGGYADFAGVASGALTTLLSTEAAVDRPVHDAVEHVVAGFGGLDVHPDVPGGMRALADAGSRLITLTNGSAESTAGLLDRAGLGNLVERCLSVAAVRRWKPAPEPYLYAARECDADPGAMMLVAVHPWDVDGAHRAGLRACWLNRDGATYPPHLTAPDITVSAVPELAAALA